MRYLQVVLPLLTVLLAGCGVVSNPFRADTVALDNACDVDLTRPFELERISFHIPAFWSLLRPCEQVWIIHDNYRDKFSVEPQFFERHGSIVTQSKAAGFGISSSIHLIGKSRLTPETWLSNARERWVQSDNGHRVERQVDRVRIGNLDCWRVASKRYHNDVGIEDLSYSGVSYTCWPDGDNDYPPISLSAGMRYVDERPLYDVDIDSELLLPVLKSLEIRELSPDAYAARKQAYLERQSERCKGIARMIRVDGEMNEYQRERLEECGYDLETLEPPGN